MKNIGHYNVLKQAEGGMGGREAKRRLAEAGIKAKQQPSVYVGHVCLVVEAGARDHKRAEQILGIR